MNALIGTARVSLIMREFRCRRGHGRILFVAAGRRRVSPERGQDTEPRARGWLTREQPPVRCLEAIDSRDVLLVTVGQRRMEAEQRERLGGHRPPRTRDVMTPQTERR